LPVRALEDVRVLRGVTLGAEPYDVSVWVGTGDAPHGDAAAPSVMLELRGASDHVHVRASAILGVRLPPPPAFPVPEALRAFRTPIDRVYAEQLFHGSSLEAIRTIDGIGDAGMVLSLATHETSEKLLPGPAMAWSLDPLVLDGVFQALIVWCRAHVGAPSLPSRVASVRLFAPFSAASVRAVVTVRAVEGLVVNSDVDLLDDGGTVLVRLEGFICTASASLQRAFTPEASRSTPLPTA
jgi:hypothetical protein